MKVWVSAFLTCRVAQLYQQCIASVARCTAQLRSSNWSCKTRACLKGMLGGAYRTTRLCEQGLHRSQSEHRAVALVSIVFIEDSQGWTLQCSSVVAVLGPSAGSDSSQVRRAAAAAAAEGWGKGSALHTTYCRSQVPGLSYSTPSTGRCFTYSWIAYGSQTSVWLDRLLWLQTGPQLLYQGVGEVDGYRVAWYATHVVSSPAL